MQQNTHHSPTVLAYAQSLLELAEEQNQIDAIDQELGQIREVLDQNPTFVAYLADPGISHEERSKVLKDTFANQVSPLLWNFMGVLNLKGRLKLLSEISAAFDDLLDESTARLKWM